MLTERDRVAIERALATLTPGAELVLPGGRRILMREWQIDGESEPLIAVTDGDEDPFRMPRW
jgi:hypothetical protein